MGKLRRANQIRKNQGYRVLFRRAYEHLRDGENVSDTSKNENYKDLCEKGEVERPHYGYCAYRACRLATKLGHDRVSLIEFGVAGGNGLLNLETHAEELEDRFDIHVEVYGFDTGEGLPEPRDYRDSPYIWKSGHFDMDVEALKSRTNRSNLVMGDVKDTIPEFISEHDPAPVGAIFSDLDFYSSTIDSFRIFDIDDNHILPRVITYFDDVCDESDDWCQRIQYIGQPQAIRDFNSEHEQEKIGKVQFNTARRQNTDIRPAKIYSYHRFEHEEYNTYVGGKEDKQFPLRRD